MDLLLNVLFTQILVGLAFFLCLFVSIKNVFKLKGTLQGLYYCVIVGGLLVYLDTLFTGILFTVCSAVLVLLAAVINKDIK